MKLNVGWPTENGMYVAYVSGVFETYPEKLLLTFVDGTWFHPGSDQMYRMAVEGWVGPLPSPRQDELNEMQVRSGNAPQKYAYAIGKKLNQYTEGPFYDLVEVLNSLGDEGEYIFRVGDEDDKAIRKWVEEKGKWIRLKRKSNEKVRKVSRSSKKNRNLSKKRRKR